MNYIINKLLNIYKTQYDKLTKARKKEIKVQNVPENLPIDLYLDDLPPLEDDEGLKSEPEEIIAEKMKLKPREEKIIGTGLKFLTPNKFLTKLPPISLARIKTGNNSYELKIEIRQILYLFYQHNRITKKHYNNLSTSL